MVMLPSWQRLWATSPCPGDDPGARDSGPFQESLYKALSGERKPELDTT